MLGLQESLPGRAPQLRALSQAFGFGGHPLTLLSGPSGSGKSATLSRALSTQLPTAVAWIHCIERFTDSLVLESILDQLSGTGPSVRNAYATLSRCDSLQAFVPLLNALLDGQDAASPRPMHRFVVRKSFPLVS